MKRNLLTLWAKRSAFALALAAVAGLTLPSCDKEPKEEPYREPYEKELFFNQDNLDSIEPAVLKHFARDKACTHIYLHVTDDNNFTGLPASNVRNYLQQRIEISSKNFGRGDLVLVPGKTSITDSLWFVQNGWTINKRYWDSFNQH